MKKIPSRSAAPAPAPAAPPHDLQMRELLTAVTAMTQTMSAAMLVMSKHGAAPTTVAPPAPPEEPSAKRAGLLEALSKAKRTEKPAPAAALAVIVEPAPAYKGPITATVTRDKRERLAGVSMAGGCQLTAEVDRDAKDRMNCIYIECDGKKVKATIARNDNGRITNITIPSKEFHADL